MTAPKQNIDLKQSEIKQIDATELQKLIQDFESKKEFSEITNNFDLNKDSTNISETENKILAKLQELGEINKQIDFLKNLANAVENRIPIKKKQESKGKSSNKKKEEQKQKSSTENKGQTTEDGFKIQKLDKEKQDLVDRLQEATKHTEEEQEKIEQINQITKKYNSLSELLNNKNDRRKILEIDYPEGNCPFLDFSNGKENFKYNPNNSLDKVKVKIAEIENKEIAKQLDGILAKEDINNILTGSCQAENLREKLKATNKFNDSEIESLINGIAGNKKTLAQIYLRNKLKEKGASLEELINLKDGKEKGKYLMDKGFNKTEKKEILDKYGDLKKATEAELTTMINILKFGLEGYNEFTIDYFEKNPEDIRLINNKNKLGKVIDFLIKKNPEYFKKHSLTEIVNPEFSSDIDFVENFALKLNNNGIKNKLDFFDIKNIKFSSNKDIVINELIIIFNIVDEKTIKMLLRLNIFNTIENNFFLKNKNYILKKIEKNNLFKKRVQNIFSNYVKEIKKSDNIYEEIFDDIVDDINVSNVNNKYLKYINNITYLKENELIKLDVYLSKSLESLVDSNSKNINILLNSLSKNYQNILLLPKTFGIIQSYDELLNKFVKTNPKFYSLLPESRKEDLSIKYADSILKSNTLTKKEQINLLAELRFKNVKQRDIIFNKLQKKLTFKELQKILLNPNFSLYYSNFLEKNTTNIIQNSLNKNTSKESSIAQGNLDDLNNKLNRFKSLDSEVSNRIKKGFSELKNTISTNTNEGAKKGNDKVSKKASEGFEKIRNETEILIIKKSVKILEKYKDNQKLQAKISEYISALAHGKDTTKILENLAKELPYEEYEKIIEELDKNVKEAIKESNEKIKKSINKELETNPEKGERLKKLGLLNENGEFDEKAKERLATIYKEKIKKKKEKLKKEGKTYDCTTLKEETINEILQGFGITGRLEQEFKKLLVNTNIEDNSETTKETYSSEKAYTTLKSGNKEAIKALQEEYKENYDKNIANDIKRYYEEHPEEREEIENIVNDIDNKTLQENLQKGISYTNKEINTNSKSNIIQTNDYSWNKETGAVKISENGETDTIKLNPKEQMLVNSNPEVLDNIVDFYKTLSRLGLKKLWTIKEQLFKSIENVMGIGFRIDGDYLNENEIKIFLNAILKSIGEKEIPTIFSLETFLSSIERLNKTQAISGSEAIESIYYEETHLEHKLFNKFVPRNSMIISFKFEDFEDAISGKTTSKKEK